MATNNRMSVKLTVPPVDWNSPIAVAENDPAYQGAVAGPVLGYSHVTGRWPNRSPFDVVLWVGPLGSPPPQMRDGDLLVDTTLPV
jgi:hypothetical protein